MTAPRLDFKVLQKPIEELDRLEREHADAQTEVEAAASAIPAAMDADKGAKLAARLDGAPKPAPTAEAAVARHKAAQEELQEAAAAVEIGEERLKEAVAANSVQILKGLDAIIDRDRAELGGLLDQVEAVAARLGRHKAEALAAEGRPYNPNLGLIVAGLLRPNGEPHKAGEVVAELRALTRPPEKVIERPIRKLARSFIGEGVHAR